eukprot:SAG25_NODE_1589_length_2724_cov_1.419429_1_plen_180_part_10
MAWAEEVSPAATTPLRAAEAAGAASSSSSSSSRQRRSTQRQRNRQQLSSVSVAPLPSPPATPVGGVLPVAGPLSSLSPPSLGQRSRSRSGSGSSGVGVLPPVRPLFPANAAKAGVATPPDSAGAVAAGVHAAPPAGGGSLGELLVGADDGPAAQLSRRRVCLRFTHAGTEERYLREAAEM